MRPALLALLLTSVSVRAEAPKPYTIEAVAPATVEVGKAASVRLTFTPKAPYHTSLDFPTRLNASATGEIVLPNAVQKRSDAKSWTAERGEFEISFTAKKAGPFQLHAELRSAVCSKATCIPLREKLVWNVTAQ